MIVLENKPTIEDIREILNKKGQKVLNRNIIRTIKKSKKGNILVYIYQEIEPRVFGSEEHALFCLSKSFKLKIHFKYAEKNKKQIFKIEHKDFNTAEFLLDLDSILFKEISGQILLKEAKNYILDILIRYDISKLQTYELSGLEKEIENLFIKKYKNNKSVFSLRTVLLSTLSGYMNGE